MVITNRRGGRIEFGTTLGGSAGKLDGVAYRDYVIKAKLNRGIKF